MIPRAEHRALLGHTARSWMLAPLALSLAAAYATFFEQATDSPLFQSVIALAPAGVWGAGWTIISVLAMYTLRYGTAWSYMTVNVGMVFMSLMWGGSTLEAKLHGTPVTWTAVGVWAFVAVASLLVTVAPFKVARPVSKP